MSDRDPASSAPLSELVAVNVAGDIEAVAEDLAAIPIWGKRTNQRTGLIVARLRRIAAGIREGQG